MDKTTTVKGSSMEQQQEQVPSTMDRIEDQYLYVQMLEDAGQDASGPRAKLQDLRRELRREIEEQAPHSRRDDWDAIQNTRNMGYPAYAEVGERNMATEIADHAQGCENISPVQVLAVLRAFHRPEFS